MNSCQLLVGDSPEVRRNHYASTMPTYAKKKMFFSIAEYREGKGGNWATLRERLFGAKLDFYNIVQDIKRLFDYIIV